MKDGVAWVLSLLLCFLLMVTVCGFVLRGMASPTWWTAAFEDALPHQRATVEAAVRTEAAAWGFDADAAMALLTDDDLSAWQREGLAWVVSYVTGESVASPTFHLPGLAETVLADAGFQAAVPAAEQQSAAIDEITAHVDSALRKALLPLRTDALLRWRQDADSQHGLCAILQWVARWGLAVLLGLDVLLCILILCCLCIDLPAGMSTIGGTITAAGVLLLVAYLTRPVDAVREVSEPLAAFLSLGKQRQVLPFVVGGMAICGLLPCCFHHEWHFLKNRRGAHE